MKILFLYRIQHQHVFLTASLEQKLSWAEMAAKISRFLLKHNSDQDDKGN